MLFSATKVNAFAAIETKNHLDDVNKIMKIFKILMINLDKKLN